ncbi:TonB family protein [Pedobacter sp. N23S346]|uniref:TonB family protein n=1 Tax=Pedobacter sp. N23S346 TaxID=3402750 RepID=UPI003AC84D0F
MSFAHYLLQVNLYLIVFYGFYKLLLDRETYFILNRIYLVAAGVLSLCIPFIRLEWITEQEAAKKVYTSVNWDAVLQQATIVTDDESVLNWANAFVFIYCAGILFFLGRLMFNLFAVKKLINTAKSGSAFSFFSRKIIDKNLPLANVIDVHEDVHIKQWHTVDILFFEVLGILTWINPIIYLYKKSIKNIHEFLADQQAAEFQGDKAEYALLILSQSFGISPNSLTNGFFDKSLIKKRIFMLQKEKSKKTAIMKYGVFIPLFAILIIFSSATIRKNKKLMALSDQIPLEKPIEIVKDMVITAPELTDGESSKSIIGPSTEKVEGNWSSFYRFMGRSIKYPSEAQKNNLQGNTQIKFTLQNNKVINVSTVLDLGDGCDEEVMKALLSFKNFKDLPNGKYSLKVGFKLSGNEAKIKNTKAMVLPGYQKLSEITVVGYSRPGSTDNTEKVYDFVSIDKQPEFPGGITKFYEYLGKNIKYPKMAVDNNVSGKVFLSFIVEKNGQLSDIQVTRGLGSGTDEEAIRVIKDSPKWNPGIAEDKPVRVKYNLNVNFTLTPTVDKSKIDQPTKINLKPSKSLTDLSNFNGLLIIDGVKATDNKILNTVNPNDIESVTVLKDNSATSLYGLQATNGVILITTKKIKSGLFRNPERAELTIEKKSTFDQIGKRF